MASWTVTVRLRKALGGRCIPSVRHFRAAREDGAVLPMVALLMVVIMGITAFAIDVSSWYFDQRHLQMQADAGVLAGANQFVQGLSSCNSATTQSQIQQTVYKYADSAEAGSNGIASNGEAGAVTANVQVQCATAQGTYIDATLTNPSPPTFFSGIFGIKPTIGAHARASLEQVTEEGGSQVLPYAIERSDAVENNKLIQITVNSSSTKQALVCDGSGSSNATSTNEMYSLQVSGCPMTQVNPNGSTCPTTPLNPPSCLWQFTGVSEEALEHVVIQPQE